MSSKRDCEPCEKKTGALAPALVKDELARVDQWVLDGERSIEKTLVCKDFAEALSLVNAIGAIAESEGHHPDLLIFSWNKVRITLSTHAINGLSENDFILAEKIDRLVADSFPSLRRG
jgi:4a-hydroxytetrahydrobiopterin dehydratase